MCDPQRSLGTCCDAHWVPAWCPLRWPPPPLWVAAGAQQGPVAALSPPCARRQLQLHELPDLEAAPHGPGVRALPALVPAGPAHGAVCQGVSGTWGHCGRHWGVVAGGHSGLCATQGDPEVGDTVVALWWHYGGTVVALQWNCAGTCGDTQGLVSPRGSPGDRCHLCPLPLCPLTPCPRVPTVAWAPTTPQ